MSPFYQGLTRDSSIARRLKCPFCGEQQAAISNRRNHMRECLKKVDTAGDPK